ncbi:MAG: PAS domain-containing protein, partial [Zavarzinia sp.]|nr:PAS domain-containing protein [Zavarzinia sp.]
MEQNRTINGPGRSDRGRQSLAAAFSSVVRHVDDGILIVDDDYRIASINRFLCTAAGISESDAVGRLASSLIGWSPAEAETQEAVATTILLRTT